MTQYQLDGQVIRDPAGHYVCELIGADHERLAAMLETLAQHERIVAAKDAEIARLTRYIEFEQDCKGRLETEVVGLRAALSDEVLKNSTQISRENDELHAEVTELRAQLAALTVTTGNGRADFEVWMRSLPDVTGAIEAGLQEWDEFHQRYSNREGSGGTIQTAWVAWQGRGKLAAQQAAVPVAEVGSDGVFFLCKQPDGSPWPRGTKFYAAPAAPQQGVVMPERMTQGAYGDPYLEGQAVGWNACLGEFARLNADRSAQGEQP